MHVGGPRAVTVGRLAAVIYQADSASAVASRTLEPGGGRPCKHSPEEATALNWALEARRRRVELRLASRFARLTGVPLERLLMNDRSSRSQ